MKKRAILYVRVSTDEQNKGYSPADQKERLIKYCEQRDIDIVNIYHEDESGKTFNRPEWKKIIAYLKKNKNTVDELLFIKWDRFSRNIGNSYKAIDELNYYGVTPQAIEQPLNLEIPEQKIMLAMYLVTPEVDNDRRSLCIFYGIRRARKEGRWIGVCPRGYKNARDEKDRPIIIPEGGKTQKLIIRAFELFASGNYPIDDLRRQMNREGLKISRNSFWEMLRNKAYIGKVYVQPYKDEIGEWVQALHEGIIEESVFYTVQDILEGRKKKMPLKYMTVRDEFPLRGFLSCPRCGRTLTGSASKGSTTHVHYYHCSNGCKERQRAEDLNHEFNKMLFAFKINSGASELYKLTLQQVLVSNGEETKRAIHKISSEIDRQNQRLKNARMMALDGDITSQDLREMKVQIQNEIERLTVEQNRLNKKNQDFTEQINFCVYLFSNIDKHYKVSNTEVKQKIISSIFPEKLIFENKEYRTTAINEIVKLICSNDRVSTGDKTEKHTIFDVLSRKVETEGFEPSIHLRVYKLSRLARSTTLTSLLKRITKIR